MRMLISLGVAFFVIVLHLLIGAKLTPDLNLDMAAGILNMTFIGAAVITWLVLKYRRSHAAMIRRTLISLAAGVIDIVFLYGICFAPYPGGVPKDAAIELVVSASLIAAVTFVLLSWPTRLANKSNRAVTASGE